MPAIVDLAGVSRANAYFIPAEQLEQKEDSRRWSDQDVTELALDIAERGQLQPVLVTWDKTPEGKERLVIVAGRRRVAAIRYINERGLSADGPLKVLCLHFKGAETFAAATVENRKRKGLSAIDLAYDIQTLLDLGKTRKQIAKLLEISEPLISRTLTLLKLPVSVQRDIHKGTISAETGYEMVTLPAEDQEKFSEPAEAQAERPAKAIGQESQTEPRPSRTTAQASHEEPDSSQERSDPSQRAEPSRPRATKPTRASVRKIKRDRVERGEETSGPTGLSRKEIRELFAEFAGCQDGTIEEPIMKLCAAIVKAIDGEIGSRAVLNRMRELAEAE